MDREREEAESDLRLGASMDAMHLAGCADAWASTLWEAQDKHWCAELFRYGYEPFKLSSAQRNEMHLRLTQHMHDEVAELTRTADWKVHAKGRYADVTQVTYELVDLFKFMVNLALLYGIKADAFVKAFGRKSFVVGRRVALEKLKAACASDKDTEKLLVVDLDGVLCDRDTTLLEFANAGRPSELQCSSMAAWRAEHAMQDYEQLKADFYRSGGFLRCGTVDGSLEELKEAASSARILFVTSRDVKRYPELEWETHRWLSGLGLEFPVLFASEKEKAVCEFAPKRTVAVDDEVEHVRKYSTLCTAVRFLSPSDLRVAVKALVQ